MAGNGRRRRPPGPLSPERAWDYLLFLLSRRMYTTAELTDKLLRRGIDEAEAARLVVRLADLKLVDDVVYTDQYVNSRSSSRGRLGLRRELTRKGVAPELVEERLTELTPEGQLAAATALLRKNAWRYEPQAAQEPQAAEEPPGGEERLRREARLRARSKAFAFLARRGFTVDAAQGALEAVGWFDDDD
ncbi:MAG: regulatory protein RecX [Trueperaceae bacterium]